MSKDTGLERRYNVERVDGKEVGPCIVLELTDPNSWDALEVWSDTVEDQGYVQLASDVRFHITTHRLDWIAEQVERVRNLEGEEE